MSGLVVVDPESISPPEAIPIGGDAFKHHKDQVLLDKAHGDAENLARQFADECRKAAVSADTRVVTDSDLGVVVDASMLSDLIVAGINVAFEAADAESVSSLVTHLLRDGARPMLAVPNSIGIGRGTRTLVAYDGSVAAMRTLQLFAGLQMNMARETIVVTAHDDTIEARRLSGDAAQYLQERGYTAHARQIEKTGNVADEIMTLASQVDAGTIVAGAFGQQSWRDWLIGGTTQRLLERSTVPLFLHH